jgi:SAM-dependent methyltransferase
MTAFTPILAALLPHTRKRVQPGVQRILAEWVPGGAWLDLGCGSGALGGLWIERGLRGLYEGLDFSPVLIAEAQATTGKMPTVEGQAIRYAQANLGEEGWTKQCSQQRYDGVLMFAALHHLPGKETRLRLLRQITGLLEPGGRFIHSEWQFQRSPKWVARVQPWSLWASTRWIWTKAIPCSIGGRRKYNRRARLVCATYIYSHLQNWRTWPRSQVFALLANSIRTARAAT